MSFNKSCLYTVLSFAFAHSAFAGQESETMTVWLSPASATTTMVLGQETMQQLDKQDVAQALSVVPGVVLQESGNHNEQQVKVRGFGSRQVPVYFDGVPVYIPYDGNFDLGRFLTPNIVSAEVPKGYSSLLQGPNQMGGAINIATKRPTKSVEGNIGYRQSWSHSKDNVHDMHAPFSASNDLGYIQLSGSQLKQDFLGLPHGMDNPITGSNGKIANSSADDKRGIVRLGFTPHGDSEYVLTYVNQDGEKDNPPYAGTSSQRSRYWQWPQYDKENYYYQGTTHLGDHFTLKSRLYRDTFENALVVCNPLADLKNKKGSYSRYSDYSDGVGLQLAVDMRENDQLFFTVNWKDDVHCEKGTSNAAYDRHEDRIWSVASEYQWAAADNVDAVAGISYDWRDNLEGIKYEENGSVTHRDDNNQSVFSWQMMTKYHFGNLDTLALSYSDRTRFPTLKERYTTSKPAYNQMALVNPQLKPGRACSVDLTWNGLLGKDWRFEASIYYNRISDAILSHSTDTDTIQNQNNDRVDYTGLDAGARDKAFDMLDVGLSYGLIHADVKRSDIGKITDLPTQTLTAWMTLKPWDPLSITLSEEARSSSYSNSDGSQKAAGFVIAHLHVDYAIGHGFSVNASVNNLPDTQYMYSKGFIEEGRNYWAGIEYQF